VAAVAVIAVAGWAWAKSTKANDKPQQNRRASQARVVTVEFAKAATGEIGEKLSLTGALKPKEQVDVTPQATGRVERILVHVGDTVRSGQLIAELDDAELQQQVKSAAAALAVTRASVSQREAELANAGADLERAESLRQSGLISAQEFAATRTRHQVVRAQAELAQAQQQQAEAELRELNIRLAQTRIHSPMTGQVAARQVDVGALVSPANPIVRIVNLRTLVTAASVPEREVGKLRVGHRANVRVDAFGDQVFQGRVARIAPVLDPATRSATLEIEIPNPANRLRAEMFARVELDLASTRETVLIPRDALVYRGTQAGVYLVKGQQPVFQAVEAGQMQGDRVEVLANLAPGTTVVGRGAAMIQEGDRVAPAGGREQS
jgi:RND family efflux transporter MFP subunit